MDVLLENLFGPSEGRRGPDIKVSSQSVVFRVKSYNLYVRLILSCFLVICRVLHLSELRKRLALELWKSTLASVLSKIHESFAVK